MNIFYKMNNFLLSKIFLTKLLSRKVKIQSKFASPLSRTYLLKKKKLGFIGSLNKNGSS